MKISSVEIKKGITLYYIPSDKFTSNYFSVHFLAPLRGETAAQYSLLAKVLKKGCRAYPTQELIAKRAEELYAAVVTSGVTKIGEMQSFFFSSLALDNRFSFDGEDIGEGAFSLLRSLLTDPYLENGVFSEEIVTREKQTLCDRIRAQINNKSTYAVKRCREIMCEKENYRFALDGTVEDVLKIESAELYRLYKTLLASAPIKMFYIGAEDLQTVTERVNTLCASLDERSGEIAPTECVRKAVSVKRVTETVNAVQGKLVLGFRTACMGGEENAAALSLFDTVYGSSPISKLFMNVREKLGICYYCSSKCDLNKGIMFVSCGVENTNAQAAEKEILSQLRETANGVITEKELAYAKAALKDSLLSVSDSQGSVESWYLNYCVRDVMCSPEQIWEKIEKLTAEDVQRAAADITLDTVYFLEGTAEGDACDDES